MSDVGFFTKMDLSQIISSHLSLLCWETNVTAQPFLTNERYTYLNFTLGKVFGDGGFN